MLQLAFSILGTVIQSRVGQIAAAAIVAWFWSAHETSVKYEKRIAAEKAAIEAAYAKELLRQQYAAKEISEAATRRAEDDAATVKDMQSVIDEYDKKLRETKNDKAQTDSCNIDSDFVLGVSKLDHAASSHARIARRTRGVR